MYEILGGKEKEPGCFVLIILSCLKYLGRKQMLVTNVGKANSLHSQLVRGTLLTRQPSAFAANTRHRQGNLYEAFHCTAAMDGMRLSARLSQCMPSENIMASVPTSSIGGLPKL
jgi:hypothetical protein